MIGLVLWCITLVYLFLYIWAFFAIKNWKDKFLVWGFLLSPIVIYNWDFPFIYYEYYKVCKSDAGLKVFIEPQKMNKLVLDPELMGESEAKELLNAFYPRLKAVEATNSILKRKKQFFEYKLDVIDGKYIYSKAPIKELSKDYYSLSRTLTEKVSPHFTRTSYSLNKNGEKYAAWSYFVENQKDMTISLYRLECPDRSVKNWRNGDYILVSLFLE